MITQLIKRYSLVLMMPEFPQKLKVDDCRFNIGPTLELFCVPRIDAKTPISITTFRFAVKHFADRARDFQNPSHTASPFVSVSRSSLTSSTETNFG
ncbi:MAG: hypothetical protein ACLGJE_18195 [Gammaproteobacteria bacterium]